jgi:hypothetical protein
MVPRVVPWSSSWAPTSVSLVLASLTIPLILPAKAYFCNIIHRNNKTKNTPGLGKIATDVRHPVLKFFPDDRKEKHMQINFNYGDKIDRLMLQPRFIIVTDGLIYCPPVSPFNPDAGMADLLFSSGINGIHAGDKRQITPVVWIRKNEQESPVSGDFAVGVNEVAV